MWISGCRLKEKTRDRLAEFFVGGVTARSAVDLARVNRKTAAYFFHRLQIIVRRLEDSLPVEGLVEVDESYFGGVREGKRGRGAAGEVPVFSILHQRIDHSDAYVLDRHNHINGIENFWNQAKRTLSRYNGIPKAHFPLFLKETEFRFNYGTPSQQWRTLKCWAKLKVEP